MKGGDDMAVQRYKKGENLQLTEHFNIKEFQCKGIDCGCSETLHDPALSDHLEQIRSHFGKPLRINSGYRCEKHNQAVGGSTGSRHTKGQAADVTMDGVDALELAKYAQQIGVKGIGLYGPEEGNFIHVDTRSTPFFWKGEKQVPVDSFLEAEAPKQFIYLVSCRVNGMQAIISLVFDGNLTQQIQCLPGFDVAVQMTHSEAGATFSPVELGRDTVQIVKISKWNA
jgi:hypothetical protein